MSSVKECVNQRMYECPCPYAVFLSDKNYDNFIFLLYIGAILKSGYDIESQWILLQQSRKYVQVKRNFSLFSNALKRKYVI